MQGPFLPDNVEGFENRKDASMSSIFKSQNNWLGCRQLIQSSSKKLNRGWFRWLGGITEGDEY